MARTPPPPSRSAQAGFAYVALMVALAIVGLAAAAAVQTGTLLQRRVAEQALLDAGREFRAALDSYAKATPAGLPTAPPSLQALLRDPRDPAVRRHLRAVRADPLTGDARWGLVLSPDGQGIVGIHSLSTARPIKVGHFDSGQAGFEGAASYADWVFTATPALSNVAPAAVPASGAASTAGAASQAGA